MMDENNLLPEPLDARTVTLRAIVVSAIESAKAAEQYGLRRDNIILSAKVSGVQDLIRVYRMLAAECDYALHRGTDGSGPGFEGHRGDHRRHWRAAAGRHRRYHSRVADSAAERRPHRRSDRVPADSASARIAQLHAAGDRLPRLRAHHQHLLSGHGGSDPDLPARRRCRSGARSIPASRR